MPQPLPWLDQDQASTAVKQHPHFANFSSELQQQIFNWIDKGYIILRSYFDPDKVHQINKEIDQLISSRSVGFHRSGRIMFAYRHSKLLEEVVTDNVLVELMSFLLGREMAVFQSINFIKGSQQRAHSDSIHMSTYPPGYLSAIWVALEDIHHENGPLVYYPGSHKLPYIKNKDFSHGGNYLRIGREANRNYEDKVQQIISEHQLEAEEFHAEAGDLLIWHANLIHGGQPIIREGATRRSMVAHYFARDVICYHELTQRAALLPLHQPV